MSETQQLISKLDNKVDSLINKITDLNLSNESQQGEIENLNKLLSEKDSSLERLKSEHTKEKESAVASSNEKDSTDIKIRINELVREIDNCISLLKV